MPIAVMMESSENTMSMTMIWTITQKNAPAFGEAPSVRLARFNFGMDFVGRLGDQEQPAADQDDIAPGKREAMHGDDGLGQSDQPYQQAEQQDAKHQRQRQADLARALRLRRGMPRDDHRQKDDIVDAEHDLQRSQGQQRRPGFRAGPQRDHALSDRTSRTAASLPTT